MTFESRKDRTDAAIKGAFLRILERKRLVEMSISELAREAGVSRSTIYNRYGNLSALYVSLVKDMLGKAASSVSKTRLTLSHDQLACDTAMAFCDMLRSSEEYAALIKEERFLPTLLEDSSNARTLIGLLMDKGLDFQQAYTIAIFQMGGVFAVGTMIGCKEGDWPRLRELTQKLVKATTEAIV